MCGNPYFYVFGFWATGYWLLVYMSVFQIIEILYEYLNCALCGSQVVAQPSVGDICHARSCLSRGHSSDIVDIGYCTKVVTDLRTVGLMAVEAANCPPPSPSNGWRHPIFMTLDVQMRLYLVTRSYALGMPCRAYRCLTCICTLPKTRKKACCRPRSTLRRIWPSHVCYRRRLKVTWDIPVSQLVAIDGTWKCNRIWENPKIQENTIFSTVVLSVVRRSPPNGSCILSPFCLCEGFFLDSVCVGVNVLSPDFG